MLAELDKDSLILDNEINKWLAYSNSSLGASAIHTLVCVIGHDRFRKLVEEGRIPADFQDEHGYSPALWAAFRNDFENLDFFESIGMNLGICRKNIINFILSSPTVRIRNEPFSLSEEQTLAWIMPFLDRGLPLDAPDDKPTSIELARKAGFHSIAEYLETYTAVESAAG